MGTVAASSPQRSIAGRVLYGTLFAVVVPLALAIWAHNSAGVIEAPAFQNRNYGAAIAVVGVLAILTGMLALWRQGGGLPMNAFPPPRFVAGGIYSLVPHPIYGGFVLACAGVAVFTGSASGLWLITSTVALACAALVLGYEMPDLRRRFGPPSESLWLPADRDGPPKLIERLRVYLVVILPWFVCFELLCRFSKPPEAIQTYWRFERSWPVITWAEPLYFSAYVAVLVFPLCVCSPTKLRRFATLGYAAMALVFPLYLLLPFYVPPRPFVAHTLMGSWAAWERSSTAGAAAFPSFHVVWTCIVVSAIAPASRRNRFIAWTWAVLVGASCIVTGMHSVADVLAGFAVFLAIAYMPAIWTRILCTAERIANSWREWRIGPVRIINHGAYAGTAAAVGILLIDGFLGPGNTVLSLAICTGALIGAALWAQWVEGSPALLRPLGFYGGMLGSMIGATLAFVLGVPLWSAFAAICVAAPWIQAIGRLRCLVQGCCHGSGVQTVKGIRYTHPRSRVCRIAHLDGQPIHATPVYSILWNGVVGAALIRLVTLHASAAFICGVYLLLSGSGRFVEEAYRGEPQTRIIAGLRFYQWIAIVCVIAGAALTCVRNTSALLILPARISTIVLALGCGLLTWFVSGVDFPESSHRFARLT